MTSYRDYLDRQGVPDGPWVQREGRVPLAPGSREPSPSVSAASGFDPSRIEIPPHYCYASDQCVFLQGHGLVAGSDYRFGPWRICFDPPPIPLRTMDWHYQHDDDDGAPDGYAGRSGSAPSLLACCQEIDDLLDDMAHDCACSAPTLADCMGVGCSLRFKLRDTDRSGEADETAKQAQPKARAGAEGIAQGQQP